MPFLISTIDFVQRQKSEVWNSIVFSILCILCKLLSIWKSQKSGKYAKGFPLHLPIFFIDQGALARGIIVVCYWKYYLLGHASHFESQFLIDNLLWFPRGGTVRCDLGAIDPRTVFISCHNQKRQTHRRPDRLPVAKEASACELRGASRPRWMDRQHTGGNVVWPAAMFCRSTCGREVLQRDIVQYSTNNFIAIPFGDN